MRGRVAISGCLLLLTLAFACEDADDADLPLRDSGVIVSNTGDSGAGGTAGSMAGGASGGGRAGGGAGGATGTGGSGGLDPNKAYLFIIHASNRFKDERIDFCMLRRIPAGQTPMGPILAASGGPTGIAFGEISAPREVQSGTFQDLLVVRGGSTDCNTVLSTGSANGSGGQSIGIVLFLQQSGSVSFGFNFVAKAVPGKDAINFRNFVHDGAAMAITTQFVPDVGTPVDFKAGADAITPLDAPVSGRIVVTSASLTTPIERPYKAVAGARTSVMLLGDGSNAAAWRLSVCDHDAPEIAGAVDCRDTVRR